MPPETPDYPMFVQAFIGLGSNQDTPVAQLDDAVSRLQRWSGISLLAVSGYYGSAPVGPQDQPDFVNAVAEISTSLSPHDLLQALQKMEAQQGRVRTEHWGPRTLDLDILLYGDATIDEPDLTVPHPELLNRLFVLAPLMDLAPDLVLAGHDLDFWADRLPDQDIYPL